MGYVKAKIIAEREGSKEDTIFVMFNPAEYNLSDSASYSEKKVPGMSGPITQFISGEATTLKLSLMFDTYETSPEVAGENLAKKINGSTGKVKPTNVAKLTTKIVELTEIDGKMHRPPICRFVWGALNFRGVITNVDSSYTMFTEDGMPVRARLEVSFKSVTDLKESKKKSPFESPDRTKYKTVEQGMQLWHIAWEEYGDPEMWRVIAQENDLADARKLTSGQMLKIPAL